MFEASRTAVSRSGELGMSKSVVDDEVTGVERVEASRGGKTMQDTGKQ